MRAVLGALLIVLSGVATAAFIRSAETVEVVIDHHAFSPMVVSVRVGETVRWINRDSVPHVVAAGQVISPVLAPGESFEWTFFRSVRVDYGCSLHPKMAAELTVN